MDDKSDHDEKLGDFLLAAEAPPAPDPVLLGALLGWHSFLTPHGIALRLQTAASLKDAKDGTVATSDLTLSVAQMRALAHNLTQLADQREGVKRPVKRKWLW